jgi:hypothetical protein
MNCCKSELWNPHKHLDSYRVRLIICGVVWGGNFGQAYQKTGSNRNALICIRQVPGSKLGRDTGCPHLRYSLSSLVPPGGWQESTWIRPRPLPYKLFPCHHLPDTGCYSMKLNIKQLPLSYLGCLGKKRMKENEITLWIMQRNMLHVGTR